MKAAAAAFTLVVLSLGCMPHWSDQCPDIEYPVVDGYMVGPTAEQAQAVIERSGVEARPFGLFTDDPMSHGYGIVFDTINYVDQASPLGDLDVPACIDGVPVKVRKLDRRDQRGYWWPQFQYDEDPALRADEVVRHFVLILGGGVLVGVALFAALVAGMALFLDAWGRFVKRSAWMSVAAALVFIVVTSYMTTPHLLVREAIRLLMELCVSQ